MPTPNYIEICRHLNADTYFWNVDYDDPAMSKCGEAEGYEQAMAAVRAVVEPPSVRLTKALAEVRSLLSAPQDIDDALDALVLLTRQLTCLSAASIGESIAQREAGL